MKEHLVEGEAESLTGSWSPVPKLEASDRTGMFALLHRCFEGVDPDGFQRDLEAKDGAVLLHHGDHLVGFSTFSLRGDRDPQGRTVSVLCSGDTIVDPRHWGSSALGRTLLTAAIDLHQQSGRQSLWWFLITSGPRTWGVLPTFFRRFFPHPNLPADPPLQEWVRRLGEERWPGCLQPGGIIRLASPQRLRPPLDTLPAPRRGDPGLAWFQGVNPLWREGDELPSLVHVHPENLTRAGHRYIGGRFGVET